MSLWITIVHAISLLYSVLLCDYAMIYVSVLLLVGIWIVPKFCSYK